MATTWWVNQGRSFERGVDALAVVWAPLANSNGGAVASWSQLANVRDGDVLVHYARSAIRGISVVNGEPYECKRPWHDPDDQNRDGRRIPVTFAALAIPLSLADIPLELRLLEDAGPFDLNGDVKQGYLFPTSPALSSELHEILSIEVSTERDASGREHTLINGETDRLGMARYRVEQPMLRHRILDGRDEAECDLCGELFPKQFLVAAHIKKRSTTTDTERRDLNNIMLACNFGCDIAYELGALRVDRNGKIYLGPGTDGAVARRLEGLRGRMVQKHDPVSSRYFAARERSFK